ncbi:MAG: glyoxylase I family protein [Pseudomonadales bacterium]|jgi:glyoxylase I family protein
MQHYQVIDPHFMPTVQEYAGCNGFVTSRASARPIAAGRPDVASLCYAVGAKEKSSMEKVTGIGGVFFRAKDPEMLSKWYEENLGVSPVPQNFDQLPWIQEAGPTVYAPFEQETEYFGNAGKSWMINFRVKDLPAMVAQLEKSGIEVTLNTDESPIGKFAKLSDPEGNPIELWQPGSTMA